MSPRRIRAIFRKELSEFRRNRQILVTMAVFPLVFSVLPTVEIVNLPAAVARGISDRQPLLYLLAIPAFIPAAVAAYSIAGERQQGTLEPVLSTPIRADEFLVGKWLAAFVPSVVLAYLVYGIYAGGIKLFADPAITSAVLTRSSFIGQLVFTPLLAGLSIWVGIAISARSSDPRIATQLSVLSALPLFALTTAVSLGAIHMTSAIALRAGIALLVIDALGWRIVSPMINRERLITGTRS
jgi:ABC-2 type transport system permease protein